MDAVLGPAVRRRPSECPCRGAPAMIDRASHPPLLERPLKVTISYTHTCNLDCALCYADCGRGQPSDELAADEWIAFIDRSIADGVIAVYFEGGEPLYRRDFLSVVAHAGRRAMTMLRTNGTLLSREVTRSL